MNLGGQDYFFSPAAALGKPLADDFFRDPFIMRRFAVIIGGVKEIDTGIERGIHDPERFFFVIVVAEIHRAQAKPADFQTGAS